MLAIDVQLTLLLLLALPVLALVTYYFRRTTCLLFRQVRQTLSALKPKSTGEPSRPAGGADFRSPRLQS